MKKITLIAVILSAVAYLSFTVVEKATWTYDKAHAKVGFGVTHMMISEVEGYFKTADVTLTTSKPDFTDAVVEVTVDASSIFTDNDKRDEHLRSGDFFDVQKYPTVTFKSFYFKRTKAANTYYVKGNLTMHGVTKAVGLTAVAKTGVNPYSKKDIAVSRFPVLLSVLTSELVEAPLQQLLAMKLSSTVTLNSQRINIPKRNRIQLHGPDCGICFGSWSFHY